MPTPEQKTREKIDLLLTAAGWTIQNMDAMNIHAARGVAVREFPLKTGFADYLLYVDLKPVGVIEAKASGTTLSGVEIQSGKYSIGLPDRLRTLAPFIPLPFLYESTDREIFFRNGLDPEPRSRRLFAFHRPELLAEWVKARENTFRARLGQMPEISRSHLWDAQFEAITGLERSLAEDKPRALIQMATGSGKTFTAINAIYRLIKHAGARRVLFLVDRGNLGKQALNEFQQFVTPDDGRKFTELYNVQRMTSNTPDPVSKVCITTIQRLYSMLRGEPDFDPELEEGSLFDNPAADRGRPKDVAYNPTLPVEYFDVMVIDECHRSIYNIWRQVLEYFDAHLIGLTATPSNQTFGFFDQNLVMEYSRQRAVLDGVNVDEQVFRIRTAITAQGSTVEATSYIGKRSRKTRELRWQELDTDLDYSGSELDRQVVAPDQIRTILQTFRDNLFTALFPGRTHVPKTLIFAKDDSHAEDIVRMTREVFGKGNDFCTKITYQVQRPEEVIAAFRNSYNPRIAVTVDMIATGTDIKPLEVLLFMRPVQSRVLFDQMRGRGTRVIGLDDLKAVTPDAGEKTSFTIVDAIGVFETLKADTETLDRKPTIPVKTLLTDLAMGITDEDTFSTLAARLTRLARTLSPLTQQAIQQATNGLSVHDLATALYDALDPDRQHEYSSEEGCDLDTAQAHLMQTAAARFTPEVRQLLLSGQGDDAQLIDEVSKDRVLEAGFGQDEHYAARATADTFRETILNNRDEITALQILFNTPYHLRDLTYDQLKALAEHLQRAHLAPEAVWDAFTWLEQGQHAPSTKRLLTDLITLVRHAIDPAQPLIPFREQVQSRYHDWLEQQAANGVQFSDEQRHWLERIAAHIGVNLRIDLNDLDVNEFYNDGGRVRALRVFGKDASQLSAFLNELNIALVA